METFTKILIALMAAAGIALLLSLPVMWLWNAVMPEIFGLIKIDWGQALCLSLLSGFLFRSSSSS